MYIVCLFIMLFVITLLLKKTKNMKFFILKANK